MNCVKPADINITMNKGFNMLNKFYRNLFILSVVVGFSHSASPQSLLSSQQEVLDYLQEQFGTYPSTTVAPVNPPQLLAKAESDECFNGIGEVYPAGPPCSEGVEKVNQAYVWSLVKPNDTTWFGTGANLACQTAGGALSFLSSFLRFQTPEMVCEFRKGQYADVINYGPLGDWRPPKIYAYETLSDTLIDKTPIDDPYVNRVYGIRFAASHNGVVLMGGPGRIGFLDAIYLFAYDADSGDFLGSWRSREYRNLRRAVNYNDQLYIALARNTGEGRVVRWVGDKSNPFVFSSVAELPVSPYEIAMHNNRLFVTTSPNAELNLTSGLYMSPEIPSEGLNELHMNAWQMKWQASDYEPDAFVASAYGGGALASFEGRLYWGTLHVPMSAWEQFALRNLFKVPFKDIFTGVLAASRASSLFSAENLAVDDPDIAIEYGYEEMLVHVDDLGWTATPNKMNQSPVQGLAGFGDPFIGYIWSMANHKDSLYIGTMDQREISADLIDALITSGKVSQYIRALDNQPGLRGADLYQIPSGSRTVQAIDRSGFGNYTSYGVRNIVSDGQDLYLGMANPANLLTDKTDALPEGGWELIRLNNQ